MTITDSRAAVSATQPVSATPREASTRSAGEFSPPVLRTPVGPDSRTPLEVSTPITLSACEPISPTTVSRPAPGILPSSGLNSHAAIECSAPGPETPRGHNSRTATQEPAPFTTAPSGLNSHATDGQTMPARLSSRGPNSHATKLSSTPDDAASRRPNVPEASTTPTSSSGAPRGSGSPDPAAYVFATPNGRSLLDPALALAADFLDDVERVKIANENRLRALTRAETDADGVDRYVGLDVSHPVVAQLAAMVDSLAEVEHAAVLNLQRMLRKHPLHAWVKAQRGVGEKQAARLLAVIGDPYWRPEIVREDGTVIPEGPRTVSALWAYCGLHVLPAAGQSRTDAHATCASGGDISTGGDSGQRRTDTQTSTAGVAARRRKGQQANWSTKAKTRAYLIAESCLKQLVKPCRNPGDGIAVHVEDCACSPYRVAYDRRKSHTAASRPEWTDGHRHADALRVSSKEVLKHLWRAAREHHLKGRAA
jgi:hypothetical protein